MSNSFATPRTVACQAPLSMEFPRQEYRSWLPFPSQGILPTQGMNLRLLHWQAHSLPLSHLGSPHRDTCAHIFLHKHAQSIITVEDITYKVSLCIVFENSFLLFNALIGIGRGRGKRTMESMTKPSLNSLIKEAFINLLNLNFPPNNPGKQTTNAK